MNECGFIANCNEIWRSIRAVCRRKNQAWTMPMKRKKEMRNLGSNGHRCIIKRKLKEMRLFAKFSSIIAATTAVAHFGPYQMLIIKLWKPLIETLAFDDNTSSMCVEFAWVSSLLSWMNANNSVWNIRSGAWNSNWTKFTELPTWAYFLGILKSKFLA